MPATPILVSDPTAFEWWAQIIIPGVGALGTIAAVVVAVFALAFSRSAKSGVENIREGLNRDSGPLEAVTTVSGEATIRAEGVVRQSWEMANHGGQVRFRNTSGQEVTLTGVEGTGNHSVTAHFSLPTPVPAGASIDFVVHRVLGGSAVVGVTLEWTLPDGRSARRTYYI